MFSESKEGVIGGINRIFVPECEKAEDWWQLMEAFHEVVRIDLIPLEWLKGKGRVVASQKICHDVASMMVVRCPGCKQEWEFRLEQKPATFVAILCKPSISTKRVELKRMSGREEAGWSSLNFKNTEKAGHFWEIRWDLHRSFSGPKEEGRKRFTWAEKSKWIDHPGPSKKMGRKWVRSFWQPKRFKPGPNIIIPSDEV